MGRAEDMGRSMSHGQVKRTWSLVTSLGWEMLVQSKPTSPVQFAVALIRPRGKISNCPAFRGLRHGLGYPRMCTSQAVVEPHYSADASKVLYQNYSYPFHLTSKILVQKLSLNCHVWGCLGGSVC